MRPFRSLSVSIVGTLLVLCAGVVVSCSPAINVAPTPTPTAEPPTATQTATPLPPTATLTATSAPSATPTPTSSNTATPPPTSTATPTPTDTPTPEPTATATRTPRRRPPDTPAPVAAAPACPAWYQAPQGGKGMLVIANEMKYAAQIDRLPGSGSPAQIDGATSDERKRIVLQLAPGRYELAYNSSAGSGSASFTIADGEMKLAQIYLQGRRRAEPVWWWAYKPGEVSEVYVGRFDIPYGCPGGLPPTPTPPPQCPAWFATPAPDKAVLVVENRSTESFDVLAPNTGQVLANVPRNAQERPGFVAITLAPGHHELETTTSKRIVVDLAPGTSIVAVHPETRQTPALLPLYGLTPPPACPGYTPPTPPPPPQCPAWFQRPQAGKGVLLIENYATQQAITGVGLQGIVLDHMLLPARGDQLDRLVLQLNPGHYEFGTQQGGFSADIAERQVYGIALAWNLWGKRAATVYMPPGCQ